MHLAVFLFAINVLRALRGRCLNVLEVGSYNVNGSLRDWILGNLCVATYIGVDIQPQQGYVDVVVDASLLPFKDESFDVVISTEVLEHVENWRAVVSELKRVLKRGGLLVITTRSPGFPLHSYPYDFWRFTVDDFKVVFSDMRILKLVEDPQAPGVLFAGVRIRETYSVPEIPIQSVLQGGLPEVVGVGVQWKTKREIRREFVYRFKGVLLRTLMLLLGFEPVIASALMAIARKCSVGRDFVRCRDLSLKFTKTDIMYYIKSLARGSESRVVILKYLALRRRFNPFLMHIIRLISSVISSLFKRSSR